jgi:UDP-3-O-acyl N-acetylglucosamine deacetylase
MMRKIGTRAQRTIGRSVEVRGTGYLTGAVVRLRFLPAPAGTGVVFLRSDLKHRPTVLARVDQVTGTARRTTLGRAPGEVGLVEHVLAALAGLKIDNCIVDVDAPEPPGLDGSALAFVQALVRAGIVRQGEERGVYTVTRRVVVTAGRATLAIHPVDDMSLTLSYFLDYGYPAPIGRQMHTEALTPGNFIRRIAPCRTFLLEQEVAELRQQGLGSRTTTADLLIFGPRGVVGNKLRFANEPARHKILDMIGDLALLGVDLVGHVVACRSGHPLNVELARALFQDMTVSVPVGVKLAA